MKAKSFRPRKSLRTMLMLWFILFSVVPLAFITGYSLVKYEKAIDNELSQRLKGNRREIEVILSDYENALIEKTKQHAKDKSLRYYLSNRSISKARDLAVDWMSNHFAQSLSIFDSTGRLDIALYKDGSGTVKRNKKYESSDVALSDEYLKKAGTAREIIWFDVNKSKSVELIVFSQISSSQGRLIGYIEERILVDEDFLKGLKNRLNLELFLFFDNFDPIVATEKDLELYRSKFFKSKVSDLQGEIFDLNIRSSPHGVSIEPIYWGKEVFYLGLAASKSGSQAVLTNVKYAFFTVVGAIVILLVLLSLIISKILLRPLYDLVSAIENINPDGGKVEIPQSSDTEFGVLTESFNEMAGRVHDAQKELKDKISELENANDEIKDTQTKLVHTAKMASLGQLVAGVAHELNNPIGFIYSNMGHLREYSEKLIDLANTAETSPKTISEKKKEVEFEYIVEDLPKLIKSCEDGAKRTRDIVMGLRNFSRLEEAKIKEVDIHDGIETTLSLLQGELKAKVVVKKDFAELPKVMCYPSQLNQVFMNILSNAAQAIESKGEIHIKTKKISDNIIQIEIRDTGKGMAKETAEKIFDPFFTTKTQGKGTGLGMSISYGIIQKHGGDIQVTSMPGKGTTFKITLPVKPS